MSFVINVVDPENNVTIIDSAKVRSIANVQEFLVKHTMLDVLGQARFLTRLQVEGIEEQIHGDNNTGHYFDVTAMVEED